MVVVVLEEVGPRGTSAIANEPAAGGEVRPPKGDRSNSSAGTVRPQQLLSQLPNAISVPAIARGRRSAAFATGRRGEDLPYGKPSEGGVKWGKVSVTIAE